MKNEKNILFITWDSNITNYLENLFLPIFHNIQLDSHYRFHIYQLTWADENVISNRKKIARDLGVKYKIHFIRNGLVNKIKTIFSAEREVEKYCKANSIDYIMPRSIWPGFISLMLKTRRPILYDADGLAYLEKKLFSKKLIQPYLIRIIEQKIINQSSIILTRTKFSIQWFKENYNLKELSKFHIISNGVSPEIFKVNNSSRETLRLKLGLNQKDLLFIYVGSIGKKYGLDHAIRIFINYNKKFIHSKFLILSSQLEEAEKVINKYNHPNISVKTILHEEVNEYLNAADIGFCLIEPNEAIKAVNPIKLNEYLLSGLPVIINRGIGDTEEWLEEGFNCAFVEYDKSKSNDLIDIKKLASNANRYLSSDRAMKYCSINTTVKQYICALDKIST